MPRLSYRIALCTAVLFTGCSQESNRSAAPPVPVTNEPARTTVDYAVEGPDGETPETEFQTTGSGLKYRILRAGTDRKPSATDTVSVSYRGWLDDGTEFDSSYKRNEPTRFPLNGVIAGWTEGLQLIGVGGKIELEIPSDLGYGPRGAGTDVPPNATLHFVVELHEVR